MNYSICEYYKFTLQISIYVNTSVSKTTTHKLRILDKFQKSCDFFQPLNFLKLILRTKKKKTEDTTQKGLQHLFSWEQCVVNQSR
jgi:hypothetical protein